MSDYHLTAGRKRSKETYHTERDCPELQNKGRQSTTYRYINSKASLTECKYCSGEAEPTRTNNREIYNALDDANAEDVSAD